MPWREQFETNEAFERALRDYFAAQALAGICSKDWSHILKVARENGETVPDTAAMSAFNFADAMLKARSK